VGLRVDPTQDCRTKGAAVSREGIARVPVTMLPKNGAMEDPPAVLRNTLALCYGKREDGLEGPVPKLRSNQAISSPRCDGPKCWFLRNTFTLCY
jgi:hypothetical protein